ncbi:bis(5'-nucleosyl)-tetraphosphatase [Candidatus Magnetominusculus xianensis]|uniref:Bis(5'-nucleosyl)-tetraphosphatase [asymmetrical] n=1 Tax=Candidatus Magnetominusculus xianensis TaxID=1748249 RepID=A0ABR5SGZ9_9BACT|nr:NUDIX domain-containing protein [Candidatus Magnetominusculus xianensis]KWT90971.1 NUDIX domain-containing protein [Candidatus Magnetominusculus xianensis]MBF0403125.1 NUDIX domain-containing protein [Nitrospirota bacterium]
MLEDRSYGIIAVYEEGGAIYYLLLQHNAGHWAFPKGHAEGSESPYEAACREFREETGIHDGHILRDKSFIENYSYTIQDDRVNKTVQYFLGRVTHKSVSIQHEEIKAYKWAEFPEAEATITFAECKRLLQEVRQYIETENSA